VKVPAKIAVIICYVGKLPGYFRFFEATCRRNDSIDFFIFNDTVSDRTNGNVHYRTMDLAAFNVLASEKLGMPIRLTHGWKLNELKPAFGVIFDDLLSGYDFWAWADLDIIFGNMRAFLTEETLRRYDVYTTRAKWTTGHFTLFRNNESCRALFRHSPDYQKIFTAEKYTAFEESCHRWHGDFFAISDLVKDGKLVSMYDVVRNLEKQGAVRAHFADIVREHPQPVNYLYNNGTLTDLADGGEFFYHHLITVKKIWRFYIPAWKTIPSSFRITPYGICRIGEDKGWRYRLWRLRRAWFILPQVLRSASRQRLPDLARKAAGELTRGKSQDA